jgi:hypothetical protein
MRTLMVRAAARRAKQASTQVMMVIGRATSALLVDTQRVVPPHAASVWQGGVTMTLMRRHLVLIVKQGSTLLRGRRTARLVRLVVLILTAILRQCAMAVLTVTMLRLVFQSALRALRVSMTMTAMRAQRV